MKNKDILNNNFVKLINGKFASMNKIWNAAKAVKICQLAFKKQTSNSMFAI